MPTPEAVAEELRARYGNGSHEQPLAEELSPPVALSGIRCSVPLGLY